MESYRVTIEDYLKENAEIYYVYNVFHIGKILCKLMTTVEEVKYYFIDSNDFKGLFIPDTIMGLYNDYGIISKESHYDIFNGFTGYPIFKFKSLDVGEDFKKWYRNLSSSTSDEKMYEEDLCLLRPISKEEANHRLHVHYNPETMIYEHDYYNSTVYLDCLCSEDNPTDIKYIRDFLKYLYDYRKEHQLLNISEEKLEELLQNFLESKLELYTYKSKKSKIK